MVLTIYIDINIEIEMNNVILIKKMTKIDYINESYFAVLGLTGAVKISFLNTISEYDNYCLVGALGKACTQKNHLVSFVYNNHRFNAIDTPGLDDTDNNEEKVNVLKNLLKEHPKIKKIILVKKYNDLRLPKSMQDALKTFMEAFPLQTFWDHVIIVNSWANPHDETFTDYLEEEHEKFLNKILDSNNLTQIMNEKTIKLPTELKEYFVCSKKIKKYKELQEKFDKIKDDIKSSKLMFKEVEVSEIKEDSRESEKNKGFYIIKKYKTITCTDFDNKKTTIEEILEEKEVAPKDCTLIKTENEAEFMENDEVRWYDIVTLGIARAIRNTKKYKIFKVNYYQVGNKEIMGEKVYDRIEFR